MERHMICVTKAVNYHHVLKMELSSSLEFRSQLRSKKVLDLNKGLNHWK